jgi:hypothetical protein
MMFRCLSTVLGCYKTTTTREIRWHYLHPCEVCTVFSAAEDGSLEAGMSVFGPCGNSQASSVLSNIETRLVDFRIH